MNFSPLINGLVSLKESATRVFPESGKNLHPGDPNAKLNLPVGRFRFARPAAMKCLMFTRRTISISGPASA
jgi:hypothetical protein